MHHFLSSSIRLSKNNLFLIFTILLFLFLRISFLAQWMPWGDDTGRQLLEVENYILEQKIPFIGPPVSLEVNGRHFFHGPYEYYFIIPFFVIFSGDPLLITLMFIFWNAIGVFFLFKTLERILKPWQTALATTFIFSLPAVIPLTTTIWNPNLLLPPACALLYLLTKKNHYKIDHFLIGLLVGFGILLHYQAVLWLPLYLLILLKHKNFVNAIYLLLGMLLSLSPMILFELRHGFFNTQTALYVLQNASSTSAGLNFVYLISFLPFVTFLICFLIKHLWKGKIFLALIPVIFIFTAMQIQRISQWENHWNYTFAHQTALQIKNSSPDKYNVANLITGDTQAHALRYLLHHLDKKPAGTNQYRDIQALFVIAPKERNILENPPYEISEFDGCIATQKNIDSNGQFILYRLQKECL